MRNIIIIIIIAALYSIIAELSEFLAMQGTIISPVWPPAGIALAAVLIFGNIALIGVFIGCFIADFQLTTIASTTLNAVVPASGAALQAYVGKIALGFFAGTYNIFKNTKSVLVFIFISSFGACLINATMGVSALLLTDKLPWTGFSYSWLTWWIADAVGVVTVTSTIIAWTQTWRKKITFLQVVNFVMTWIFLLIVGYILSSREEQLTYLLIPFAIWAAFQFELRFSLLTGLLISLLCLYGTMHGYGVIHTQEANTAILLVQIFISIVFLTILLIHAILSDRQKAYENLQLLNTQLEKRVLDRTKELSDTNQKLEVQKNKAIEAFEALKQSHARLMQSEKMASLGILTAGVAHEIKHPLHAMSANMASMQTNMDQVIQSLNNVQINEHIKKDVNRLSENTHSLIAATNEGIKRTADILTDLCAFASADEPEMVMTDIHRNIDSTLNLLGSEIKGNITVTKEYGKVPLLLCHPGKMNQVIMNILINAIHALQTRPKSKINIKTQCNDHTITISIKDNGMGMRKEVLDQIFAPFFTTKESNLGSGLGLFISYNIVREHRGTISVTSELEKGTEFIITLPINKEVHH